LASTASALFLQSVDLGLLAFRQAEFLLHFSQEDDIEAGSASRAHLAHSRSAGAALSTAGAARTALRSTLGSSLWSLGKCERHGDAEDGDQSADSGVVHFLFLSADRSAVSYKNQFTGGS
jgi:hypothetical protein